MCNWNCDLHCEKLREFLMSFTEKWPQFPLTEVSLINLHVNTFRGGGDILAFKGHRLTGRGGRILPQRSLSLSWTLQKCRFCQPRRRRWPGPSCPWSPSSWPLWSRRHPWWRRSSLAKTTCCWRNPKRRLIFNVKLCEKRFLVLPFISVRMSSPLPASALPLQAAFLPWNSTL